MKRFLAVMSSFSLSLLGCGVSVDSAPEVGEVSTASLTYAECVSQPLCSDYANQACNPVGSVLECCRIYYPEEYTLTYWIDYLSCTGTGRTGHWLYE